MGKTRKNPKATSFLKGEYIFAERVKIDLREKESTFGSVNSRGEDEIAAAAKLEKARDGKSWICPVCGRGSRRERPDGIKQKSGKGRLNWWCPHCGENWSNADLIAASYGITDTRELGQKLEELFGENKGNSLPLRRKDDMDKVTDNSAQKNYAKMYEVQRRALPNFLAKVGGKWRGLTNETLHEAGAGYNAKYKSVILPYDDYTYFWREVEGSRRGINTGGKRRLYVTTSELKTGKVTINFLTEGEIDALSIKQALKGWDNIGVAATGSVSFSQMLICELNERFGNCAEKPRFIWLGDNDSAKDTEKMVSALNAAGYATSLVYFAKIDANKIDANDYLCKHGDKSLLRFLIDAIEYKEDELQQRAKEIQERTKQERLSSVQQHGETTKSLADYLEKEFDAELDKVSEYSCRATGFENLDKKQIFLPGVYVLGGSPGTGKTTFAWQLLSQLAEGDELKGRSAEHCVYCSYEMSRLELASKSIAREMRRHRLANKDVGLCLSSAEIRRGGGRDTEEFKSARGKFSVTAKNLRISELSNTTLAELLVMLNDEAKTAKDLGLPLTIAIDYLQLIPVENSKATAKERVDEIMLALKTFQRETNATLIVISSLNRESNKCGGNSLFSFKESGAIEYSADVTWHLLYEKPEGKETLPRYVELQCAKNRNGATYKVAFDYYADSDYFCPNTTGKGVEEDDSKDTKKNKHKR